MRGSTAYLTVKLGVIFKWPNWLKFLFIIWVDFISYIYLALHQVKDEGDEEEEEQEEKEEKKKEAGGNSSIPDFIKAFKLKVSQE